MSHDSLNFPFQVIFECGKRLGRRCLLRGIFHNGSCAAQLGIHRGLPKFNIGKRFLDSKEVILGLLYFNNGFYQRGNFRLQPFKPSSIFHGNDRGSTHAWDHCVTHHVAPQEDIIVSCFYVVQGPEDHSTIAVTNGCEMFCGTMP